jgi:D-lactate dehydrogenase
MRIAVFGAKNYERRLLDELNPRHKHEIVYFEPLLGPDTAVLAAGSPAVAVFVNDQVDADVIKQLAAGGTKLVTTRSTGYNQIDLAAAKKSGIKGYASYQLFSQFGGRACGGAPSRAQPQNSPGL